MAFNLTAILNFKAPGMKEKLDAMNRQMARMQAGAQRAGMGARQVTGGMRAVGIAGTAMAGGIGYAVKQHAGFEKQMKSVVAKMSDGIENYQNLEVVAKKLGSTTVFSATEAAGGLEFLALAGFNAKDSIGVLPTVLKSAAASNLDLARTSNIITDNMSTLAPVMGKYGDRQKQAIKLADMMTFAQANTNTNMDQLGEAITQGGGAMANLGIPLEQIIGSLGLLADAGIKGSSGGTAMVNMFNKLQKPTAAALGYLDKMGVSYESFSDPDTGKLVSLDKIIGMIGNNVDKVGNNLAKGAAISELFGIRGQKAQFAFFNSIKKAPGLFKGLANSAGEADRQYAIMTNSLWGMAKSFTSAVSGVALEIGKLVAQTGGLMDLGASVTKPISQLSEAMMVLNMSTAEQAKLQKQMGIREFNTMISVLETDMGKFAIGIKKGFTAAKDEIISVAKSISSFLGVANDDFEKTGTKVAKFVTWLAFVGPIILGVGMAFMIINPIIIGVVGVFNLFAGAVTMAWSAIGFLKSGLVVLKTAFLQSAIGAKFSAFWTRVFGNASLWTATKNAYLAIQTGIVTGAQWLWNAAMTAGRTVMAFLTGSVIAQRIAVIATTIQTALVTAAQWLWNTSLAAGQAVVAFLTGSVIVQRIALIAGAIATKAITVAQWAWNFAMTMNPIGLIVMGIGLLVGAIVAGIYYFDEIVAATKRAWNWFTELMSPVTRLWDSLGWGKIVVMALLGPVGLLIGGAIELYRQWDKVVTTFKEAWSWMKRMSGFGGKDTVETKKLKTIEETTKVLEDKVNTVATGKKEKSFIQKMMAAGGDTIDTMREYASKNLVKPIQSGTIPEMGTMPESKMPEMSDADKRIFKQLQSGKMPKMDKMPQVGKIPKTGLTMPKKKGRRQAEAEPRDSLIEQIAKNQNRPGGYEDKPMGVYKGGATITKPSLQKVEQRVPEPLRGSTKTRQQPQQAAPQIINPQVQLGDVYVDVKIMQNADGTYTLVKKAMRHEQNKSGTQVLAVSHEGFSQARHRG